MLGAPLVNAPLPGLEAFATLVDRLEQAIDADDVSGVLAAQSNIVGALSVAQQTYSEDEPFLREVESRVYAASAWLNRRTTAGAGGRGVVVVPPPSDAPTYEQLVPTGVAQVTALQQSALTDIVANLTPGDIRVGESIGDAARRVYEALYGFPPPAGLTMPAYAALKPNVAVTTTVLPEDPTEGEGGPAPPVNGFIPSPGDGFLPEEPADDGAPAGAAAGVGVGAGAGLMLGGAAVLLFVFGRDRRRRS